MVDSLTSPMRDSLVFFQYFRQRYEYLVTTRCCSIVHLNKSITYIPSTWKVVFFNGPHARSFIHCANSEKVSSGQFVITDIHDLQPRVSWNMVTMTPSHRRRDFRTKIKCQGRQTNPKADNSQIATAEGEIHVDKSISINFIGEIGSKTYQPTS